MMSQEIGESHSSSAFRQADVCLPNLWIVYILSADKTECTQNMSSAETLENLHAVLVFHVYNRDRYRQARHQNDDNENDL